MTNSTSLTPAQLSAQAIQNIEQYPASHDQSFWHTRESRTPNQFNHPCGTSHCYAGHVDLLIGVPNTYTGALLCNNVQSILGLNNEQWHQITKGDNSVARIKALHREYFIDGVFGDEDGYDEDGYDKHGYDENGYDENGYNKRGYDENGYNKRGYNENGYDEDGYDRDGYDENGYNRHGYNRDSY